MHTQSSFKKTETEKKTFFSCFLKKTEITLKKVFLKMSPILHSLYVLFMFWIIYKIISSSQIRMYAVQSSDLTIARSPMATEHNSRLLKTHFKVAHLATQKKKVKRKTLLYIEKCQDYCRLTYCEILRRVNVCLVGSKGKENFVFKILISNR